VRAFRFGVALFAAVSMLAPFASVMPNEPMLWTVALVSQCTKICALGIGFVSITIVVNNSCEDAVKARVNGIAGTTSAFARIVAPVICGWTFAGAMRLTFPARQFLPFAFICAVTVALRVIAERLPTALDSPTSSVADVDTLPSDDPAPVAPVASNLDSPC
jgi:diphthamide biosynthesis protein 2